MSKTPLCDAVQEKVFKYADEHACGEWRNLARELELKLALRPEGGAWKLSESNVANGFAFYEAGEEVTLYCMDRGSIYECTVKLPPIKRHQPQRSPE